LLRYADKVFSLRKQWKLRVRDSRPKAQIPTAVFPATFFLMFCCRLPSFNELEQHKDRSKGSWRRWLEGSRLPSADELAYTSERLDPEGLRDCLGHLYGRLKRNKVLEPRHGWMLAAIDGHETNSSYKRCCKSCLQRELTVNGVKKIQYYHRLVVFQLIARDFYLLLDVEMVRPGEDEGQAALRLLARVLENHPRCFDVLTADALYLRPSVIHLLESHGKELVAVLKANQPELLGEARTLLPAEPARVFHTPAAPGKPARRVELRELDDFHTETISTALRIVHAHETGTRRERIADQWVHTPIDSHWYWATTLPTSLAEGRVVFDFGHDRWKIENEGFNELVTHWHSKHCFHHHSNTFVVLWLVLFMAHAVFHCFHSRNLKPDIRRGHTVIFFAQLLTACLYNEQWWPPPT
jgi:hypothetical protein